MKPSGYWISRLQLDQFTTGRDVLCRGDGEPDAAQRMACLWLTGWLAIIIEQPLPEVPEEVTVPLPFDSAVMPLEITAMEPFGPDAPDIDILL